MGKRKERDGIVLLNEHMLFAQEVLTGYERAELYDAIRAYSMDNELPDMVGKRAEWRGIFRIMRAAQDKAILKYEQTRERNRCRAQKRWQTQDDGHDGHGRNDEEDADAVDDADAGDDSCAEDNRYAVAAGNAVDAGYAADAKQNKSKQIKTKQSKANQSGDLSGHEVEGVPGVVWA